MKISFNKLDVEYKKHKKEFDRKISDILQKGHFILGEEVEKFEYEFAKYIGVKYCVGVGNGLEALQIGLMSLKKSVKENVGYNHAIIRSSQFISH
ncbi:Glutamine--scyllo-inositol transaminase (fragment) [groundwater metagenome]|uniref:Glutamine--scyllo-inositol transaminase n=1 Tax=groundwater metagenome TaxID=717931 RepID=A0A098EE67_9ZZZZ